VVKKLFAFLFAAVICVVAVGFYRSWFTLSSSSTNAESHKVDINLTVNPDKVKADAETVKDKAAELTGQTTEGANEPVGQASENVKPRDE
jgi:cell division protein FtsX